MALTQKLLTLKSPQLKHAAFLLGLPSTGTKADLEPAIRHRLLQHLPTPSSKTPRILSIDMGIKNLGICLLEPKPLPTPSTQNINILAWQKINVLQHLTPASSPTPLFTPSALSQTALHLSTTLLQTHTPTHILIERQRFRSGGASAVQEWTLRVNMLESMLWACWATMRAAAAASPSSSSSKGGAFPAMEEVSPARVADFWCGGHAGTVVQGGLFEGGGGGEMLGGEKEKTGGGRKKVQKKEKIALVKGWLAEAGTAQLPSEKYGKVGLELVGDDAVKVKEYFLSSRRLRDGKGGVSDEGEEERVGKLDDLADCLLQGVAWIRWMENARKMRELLKDEIDDALASESN